MPTRNVCLRTVALLLVAVAAPLAWSAGSDEDAIRAAEKRWAAAVVARDIPALRDIFTDKLIYAHATGPIETKQVYLERLSSGKQRYDSVSHESTTIAIYGNAAVAHSIVRMTGNNGQPFNDHVAMMHLWVKDGGRWRLAAHQTTRLPQ